MKTLSCDVCRKKLENPVATRNYFHICHREVCEPCKDSLEGSLKPVVRTKDPFSYDWYTKLVKDSVEKAIQKGKF
ncbi:MAG: hypothetical protein FWG99_04370 [Treponema sp.]|nr:hypothetical protein [Treponema sp.]